MICWELLSNTFEVSNVLKLDVSLAKCSSCLELKNIMPRETFPNLKKLTLKKLTLTLPVCLLAWCHWLNRWLCISPPTWRWWSIFHSDRPPFRNRQKRGNLDWQIHILKLWSKCLSNFYTNIAACISLVEAITSFLW